MKFAMDGMDILKIEDDRKDELISAAVDKIGDVVNREHNHESWFDEDGTGRQYHVLDVWVSERGNRLIHEILWDLDKKLQNDRR